MSGELLVPGGEQETAASYSKADVRSWLEFLLPDELFGEVMQGMVDSAWLRERAETVAASGDPFSNEKAAALFEAADAVDSASADAAP